MLMNFMLRRIGTVLTVASFLAQTAFGADVSVFSNGNKSKTFSGGIFTAKSNGSGTFAVAVYKDETLQKISLVESDEKVPKINMVLDDDEDSIVKVFRFDGKLTPLCQNKTLVYEKADRLIYVNETFDDGLLHGTGSNAAIEDFQLCLIPTQSSPSASYAFTAYNTAEKLIVEMDVEAKTVFPLRLINCYIDDSQYSFVRIRESGICLRNGSEPVAQLNTNGKTNVAAAIDFESGTYSVYVDGNPVVDAQNVVMDGYAPGDRYPLCRKFSIANRAPGPR